VPAFLHERVAEWDPLPKVKVVRQQEGEEQGGDSGKRQASIEASCTEEEEERHAMLAYVVRQMNEQLFTELMHGLHAPEGYKDPLAGEISDTEDEEEYEEDYEMDSEGFYDEEYCSSVDEGYCDEEDYEGDEYS
jgi:hypothetical protein